MYTPVKLFSETIQVSKGFFCLIADFTAIRQKPLETCIGHRASLQRILPAISGRPREQNYVGWHYFSACQLQCCYPIIDMRCVQLCWRQVRLYPVWLAVEGWLVGGNLCIGKHPNWEKLKLKKKSQIFMKMFNLWLKKSPLNSFTFCCVTTWN